MGGEGISTLQVRWSTLYLQVLSDSFSLIVPWVFTFWKVLVTSHTYPTFLQDVRNILRRLRSSLPHYPCPR